MAKTIADKIWQTHTVEQINQEEVLLYIDLHLLHEINTPQAFERIQEKQRQILRPELTFATEDHNTPTRNIEQLESEAVVREQVRLLRQNCSKYGIELASLGDEYQGISHVIAPEQGRVLPGSTLVCCDSHTTTHGAMGALAFGIGTSQVEHVLATQTLRVSPFKNMCVLVNNQLPEATTAKDLALTVVQTIGTGGGQGYVIEYRGSAIEALSIEARMTLCNMTVEAGASAGIISPDDKTIHYIKSALAKRGKTVSPELEEVWRSFATDSDAVFDKIVEIDAAKISPMVTWGTNPSQVVAVTDHVPQLSDQTDNSKQLAMAQALDYMKLTQGQPLKGIQVDTVFVGSCTNGRIEDLRLTAQILDKRQVNPDVNMVIVPGSSRIYQQAKQEGLDIIFEKAGAQFRPLAGCSMCVGLNADRHEIGKRTLSTSNRNFEGRQGPGIQTHIASPAVAAATAILGYIATPDDLVQELTQ